MAAPLQLARLTDSFLVVGALGPVELVPLVVFGLIGGAIADELRGRLAGIELLSSTTGPSLGNGRAGLMAPWGGAHFSMSLGGLLCVGGVTAATALLPRFRHHDNRTPHRSLRRSPSP